MCLSYIYVQFIIKIILTEIIKIIAPNEAYTH